MVQADPQSTQADVFENYDHKVQSVIGPLGGDLKDLYDYKLAILKQVLNEGDPTGCILDYGCGIGHLSALLAKNYPNRQIIGFDPLSQSIENAKGLYGGIKNLAFCTKMPEKNNINLILAINVFHHIPAHDRVMALNRLASHLGQQGRIAIIEHNPYNPVTRQIVKNCALDKGVELVFPKQMNSLATQCGMVRHKRQYILFFPSILKKLRIFEKFLHFLPAGAQYLMVLKQK